MTVTVKLFAIVRDRADALGERVPALRDYLGRVAWAVNRAYVPVETQLHDGDELAVIPPVSGG